MPMSSLPVYKNCASHTWGGIKGIGPRGELEKGWGQCTRAYGLGSQCRPNECKFGSGKPWGVEILGSGVYEPGEGDGEASLRATWERGGQILSQLGGFHVSREG